MQKLFAVMQPTSIFSHDWIVYTSEKKSDCARFLLKEGSPRGWYITEIGVSELAG